MALRDIAKTTKISMSVLEALERNDIARLPAGIFSRSFVRSYAVAVGLEPEAMIREFMAQFPQDSVVAGHPTQAPVDDHLAVESDRRAATTFLRMVLISAPAAGILLYFGTVGRRPAQVNDIPPASVPTVAPAKAAAPAPAPSIPAPVVPPVVAPPPVPTLTPPAIDRLAVVLSTTAPCWVLAFVDGQRALERELAAGERHEFDVRRNLVLTISDPSALGLSVNGAPARRLGRAGRSTTIRLTLENYKEYVTAP